MPKNKYTAIKEQILEDIRTGVYPAGKPMASSNQLAARYMVNRLTVEKALWEIENEGYISRTQGRCGVVISKEKKPGIGILSPSPDISKRFEKVNSLFQNETGIEVRMTDVPDYIHAEPQQVIDMIGSHDLFLAEIYKKDFLFHNNLIRDISEFSFFSELIRGNTILAKLLPYMQVYGKVTGLPCFFSPYVLIVNTDLCTKFGISVPERFRSLDELFLFSKKFDQGSGIRYAGLAVPTSIRRLCYFTLCMNKFDMASLSDKKKIADALVYLKDAAEKNNAVLGSETVLHNIFSEGRAAMILTTYFMLEKYLGKTAFHTDLAGLPAGPDTPNSVMITGLYVTRNADTDAAAQYIQFLFSEKMQSHIRETGGGIPVTDSAAFSRVGRNSGLPQHYTLFKKDLDHFVELSRYADDPQWKKIAGRAEMFWQNFDRIENLLD